MLLLLALAGGYGTLYIHMMAALAEMVRDLLHERATAGLAAARARRRKGGRKPKLDDAKLDAACKLLQAGTSAVDVANTLGVGRSTLYRRLSGQTLFQAAPTDVQ